MIFVNGDTVFSQDSFTNTSTMFYTEKARKHDEKRRLRHKKSRPSIRQQQKKKKWGVKKQRGRTRRHLRHNMSDLFGSQDPSKQLRLMVREQLYQKKVKAATRISKAWRSYVDSKRLRSRHLWDRFFSWEKEAHSMLSWLNNPLVHLVDCKPLNHQLSFLTKRLMDLPCAKTRDEFVFFMEPQALSLIGQLHCRLVNIVSTRQHFNLFSPSRDEVRSGVSDATKFVGQSAWTSRDYEEDAWEKYMNKIV